MIYADLYKEHCQDADDGDSGGEDAEAPFRQESNDADADECSDEDEGNGTGVDGQGGDADVVPGE